MQKNMFGGFDSFSFARNSISKDRRRRHNKKIFVNRFKKECAVCGYDKHKKALAFHHVSGKKEKEVSQLVIRGKSYEAIREEINKCVILCHNCHAEVHAGALTLDRKTQKE